MFWYYENRNQAVKMHLEHSVHNRPMEKIEKNDTGGVSEKKIYVPGLRCSEGIWNCPGEGWELGFLLFLLSCTKEGKGHSYFYFPFFILPFHEGVFQELDFTLVIFSSLRRGHLSSPKIPFLCLLNDNPTFAYEMGVRKMTREGKWKVLARGGERWKTGERKRVKRNK